MIFKRMLPLICLVICLFAMASVCASDANDTVMVSVDDSQMQLSANDEITCVENDLYLSTDTTILPDDTGLSSNDNSEIVSVKNGLGAISVNPGKYSELINEVGSGGNITLKHDYYTYDFGSTIEITSDGSVIDGKGTIIDMAGSSIGAFTVSATGVIIKNLTIKNANFNGGVVSFAKKGTVTNCNFTNNTSTEYGVGGVVRFYREGTVTNCNFTNNKVTGHDGNGGALYFGSYNGTVINCNFVNNTATFGGAICMFEYGAVTNCNFVNNTADVRGGAVCFIKYNYGEFTVTNCNFVNNTANAGGAVYFSGTGNVINCNFVNNTDDAVGGAICFYEDSYGTVTNCNFLGNTATNYGGAVYFLKSGEVTNSNFIGNTANAGGAVYFSGTGNVINCNFTGNNASENGGAMYRGSSINCIFKGNKASISGDDTYNTVFPRLVLNVSDFNAIYNSGAKLTANLTTASGIPITNVNITVRVYKNNALVGTYYFLSGEGWIVGLDAGSYIAECAVENQRNTVDSVFLTINISKAASTLTVNNMVFDYGGVGSAAVSFTGAAGVTASVVDYDEAIVNVNGNIITVSNLNAGTYNLRATTITDVNHNNITKTSTITVNKLKTQLIAKAVTTTYNINKNMVIILKDSRGNVLDGVKVSVNINAAKTYITDKNGQIKIDVGNLAPKSYTATIKFAGNTNYASATKNVKVTVKKATLKLTAKAKTFKKSVKTKKYTVTLKTNQNKVMKNTKITLKVNGKTYKATTNTKGQAIFKITKLTKKGKFTAVVKFAGNKYYNAKTVNTKITVK